MAKQFEGLARWRLIGPFRGGRVVTVAGDVSRPNVFYFGGCAGGVWKTEDAGTYWECITDGYFNTSSVGAIAVSEADPNVIYAGTGEATIRIDVSHGDGVYKSTDAGRTWQHIGLEDTRHIGKIRIHPDNPDIVYVAALGHAFGTNEDRGVFRSMDGGETWEKVLYKSDKAGAIDITIDHTNPRILYATIWEARRKFWDIISGGEDSSIWRSMDGGDTWEDISRNEGLPAGVMGKMGIAASPAQPGRVWALIEHEKGGMYRSDDYGDTWTFVADNENLISRAWYYMHVTPDPVDPDTVYVNNLNLWKSTDGGRTYEQITTPHGDNHDIWIDPNNTQRMVQGNDGGACVSMNGGASWSTPYNQPTAQFYHITADTRTPFNVYGTQQDNSSLAVPSRSPNASITWTDCYIAGTAESGYIQVRPDNPDIVYVGAIGSSPGGGNALQRYDHKTKQIRLITSYPESTRGEGADQQKVRFAWTYPILISPHDPDVLYIGGNKVLKSTNEGQSWDEISPDLTKADPETLKPSGRPINRDAVGAETYATVYALCESLHEAGVLWAGSDDGLVHITRDGGETWTDITPEDFKPWTMVTMLEPSPFTDGTCYMAATRYKEDDYTPYLYKTSDYGATWERIDYGIHKNDFTRVIRCDTEREGLLYAGTETGVYISYDDGASWQSLQLNLPVSPIYDLIVKDNHLIAGTHGRSIWIIDDLNLLRQYEDDITAEAAKLMTPRPTERIVPKIFEGVFGGSPGKNYMPTLGIVAAYTEQKTDENQQELTFLDSGENPTKGAIITYWLADKPADGDLTLSIHDSDDQLVRSFTMMTEAHRQAQEENPDQPKPVYLPAQAGWNRFVWDLRTEEATRISHTDPQAGHVRGALVPFDTYKITLNVNGHALTETLEVVSDSFSDPDPADIQAQHDLMIQIRDLFDTAVTHTLKLREMRAQLDQWMARLEKSEATHELYQQVKDLREALFAVEKQFIHPNLKEGWRGMLNQGAQLLPKIAGLPAVVECGDYKPTDQAYAVYEQLCEDVNQATSKMDHLVATQLTAVNQAIADSDVAIIG